MVGLLVEPIIDLAFGFTAADDLSCASTSTLGTVGWVYRGDAGNSGGHVFVLVANHSIGWPTCTWWTLAAHSG